MKVTNKILFLISIFFIVSCSNNKEEDKNRIYINSSVSYVLDNMFIPRDIAYRDSFFIIGDRGNDKIYSVYKQETTSLKLIDTFGETGQGPNEFIFQNQ